MDGPLETTWVNAGLVAVTPTLAENSGAQETAEPLLVEECIQACYDTKGCSAVSQPLDTACTYPSSPKRDPRRVRRPCFLWPALNAAKLPLPSQTAESPCFQFPPNGVAPHVALRAMRRDGDQRYVVVQGLPAVLAAHVPTCSYMRTATCNAPAGECEDNCFTDVTHLNMGGEASAAADTDCANHPTQCADGFVVDQSNNMYLLIPPNTLDRDVMMTAGPACTPAATPTVLQNRFLTYLKVALQPNGQYTVRYNGVTRVVGTTWWYFSPLTWVLVIALGVAVLLTVGALFLGMAREGGREEAAAAALRHARGVALARGSSATTTKPSKAKS